MNKIPDLPPTSNEPAPQYRPELDTALSRLGQIDSKPFMRIVWGMDANKTAFNYREQRILRYRARLQRETVFGKKAYDSEGRMIGFSKIYKAGEIVPAGEILEQATYETEIGTPRFFIELLDFYNETEWNNGRYTDENGVIIWVNEPDGTQRPLDVMGEYPEGGLDYSMVWLCADHDNCCTSVSPSSNVGFHDDGTKCFGFRRLPNERDIEEMRKRVVKFAAQDQQNGDLRDRKINEAELSRSVAASFTAMGDHWNKVQADLDQTIYDQLQPHSKRLTSEGSGLDFEKYKDFGGKLREKLEKDSSDPSAYSFKEAREKADSSSTSKP